MLFEDKQYFPTIFATYTANVEQCSDLNKLCALYHTSTKAFFDWLGGQDNKVRMAKWIEFNDTVCHINKEKLQKRKS